MSTFARTLARFFMLGKALETDILSEVIITEMSFGKGLKRKPVDFAFA